MHPSNFLVGALLSSAAVLAAPTPGKDVNTQVEYEVDVDLVNAIYQMAYNAKDPHSEYPASQDSPKTYQAQKRDAGDLEKRRNPLATAGKVVVGVAAAPVVITVGALASLLRLVGRV